MNMTLKEAFTAFIETKAYKDLAGIAMLVLGTYGFFRMLASFM